MVPAETERLFFRLWREDDLPLQYWPIFLKGTRAHAGCCGPRPHGDICELGFHLRFEHWGQGLAIEAARDYFAVSA